MSTYKVLSAGEWVYNEQSTKEKSGRINSGATFTLETDNNIYNKVTNVNGSYSGSVVGKYMILNSTNCKKVEEKNTVETPPSDAPKPAPEENEEELDGNIASYYSYMNDEQYMKNLQDGLSVKDLRGILGMPHQFLPTTDPRIDGTTNDGSFGRKYAEKIIAPIPLLLMTPGAPTFMSSYNKKQRATLLEDFVNVLSDGELDSLINEKSGKYYSLKFDYTNYFYYVNAMLRSAAFFLGIQNETIDNRKLGSLNWLYYADKNDNNNTDIFGHEGLRRFLGTYAGAIPFYVDSETSVSNSFSNNTTQSAIAQQINGLSDKGRELNFILGNISGMSGVKLDKFTSQEGLKTNIEAVNNEINSLLGKRNILSTITGSAQTLMAGGRMQFPEIWSDASMNSRSYSVKMKLISPSGDKLSVFLNILVPIFHLLAFTLPRQSAGQAYFAPFMVRAFYKGLFNVDMGIISDLSITKGAEGEWTEEGIPTVADISFEIKDLYDGMFMSTAQDDGDLNIMSNITELDYIANSCGVNVNEPDVRRTIEMYFTLNLTSKITDKVTIGIFGNISQYFNQKLNNIFGKF